MIDERRIVDATAIESVRDEDEPSMRILEWSLAGLALIVAVALAFLR